MFYVVVLLSFSPVMTAVSPVWIRTDDLELPTPKNKLWVSWAPVPSLMFIIVYVSNQIYQFL